MRLILTSLVAFTFSSAIEAQILSTIGQRLINTAINRYVQPGDSASRSVSRVGGDLYEAVYGNCAETVQRTCEAATGESLPDFREILPAVEEASNQAVIGLVDEFYARAKREQTEVMNCEIDRMQSIFGSVPNQVQPSPQRRREGDAFVKNVMKDICQKVPELRFNYRQFTALDNRMRPLNEEIAMINRRLYASVNDREVSPALESEKPRLRSRIEELEAQRNRLKEIRTGFYDKFLLVQSSIWKGANPKMEEYLLSMMTGNGRSDACSGAEDTEAAAAIRNRFKDETVLGMIRQVMDDRSAINNLSDRGRALLLERSPLGEALQSTARSGNYSSQLAICRINAEHRGTEALATAGDVGSLLLGGLGLGLRFARVASLGVQMASRMMSVSRVALLASSAVGTMSAARGINNACFSSIPETFYAPTGNSCVLGEEGWAQETRVLESENCALAVALGAVEVAGGLGDWLDVFRAGRSGFRAADELAAASAAREARVGELLDPPTEITVSGASPRRPASLSPAEVAQREARREARLAREAGNLREDADLLNSTLRQNLRKFSTDLEGDFDLVIAGRLDEVIAKYPGAPSEFIDELRAVEAAIGRNRAAYGAIPNQPPTSITPYSLERISPAEIADIRGNPNFRTLFDDLPPGDQEDAINILTVLKHQHRPQLSDSQVIDRFNDLKRQACGL